MLLKLTTYYKSERIPELPGKNLFHSKELFRIYELTPHYKPLMIVGTVNNQPVVKLLAVIRKNSRLFIPSFIYRCDVVGIGEYLDETIDKEKTFGDILEHLTNEALRSSSIIEFRNLENALFGYKYFRLNHYFPVNWLRVRNSLHNLNDPAERISESRKRQIKKGLANGAEMLEAETQEDIIAFAKMLRKNYSAKIRKHLPDLNFFLLLDKQNALSYIGKIFIIKYKNKVIGGSVCLFSGENAYLLFSGGMRQSYSREYPGVLAVWKALTYCYENGYKHLEFMDVGLPFKKHHYREFILRFGGRQSSTRRWFRLRINFLNKLLEKIYV